jgi:hypothetical protein
MPEISPSSVAEFLERFYHCYDGLVREVRINFATRSATVLLSVQDRETEDDEGWINLALEVEGFKELSLSEGKATCVVLSGGLQVGFFDGVIYLDICPYTEAPTGLEDFRRSLFLVAGERCTWTLSPYTDVASG